jgi:hypothetical protein
VGMVLLAFWGLSSYLLKTAGMTSKSPSNGESRNSYRFSRSCGQRDRIKQRASTQCRDARLSGSKAPYAVPSIAAFAGSARRGAAMDRRACEAVQGRTV